MRNSNSKTEFLTSNFLFFSKAGSARRSHLKQLILLFYSAILASLREVFLSDRSKFFRNQLLAFLFQPYPYFFEGRRNKEGNMAYFDERTRYDLSAYFDGSAPVGVELSKYFRYLRLDFKLFFLQFVLKGFHLCLFFFVRRWIFHEFPETA